ncbi:hypothetical protein GN244_ATG20205 [Phytophthora infestans]|uniref:Uncharacterized protein n=1 Tax=Phytophthora infestans TaxID=4787 RepID=A0A833SK13_PHYIN|nr:hypothetical protein GN244_ATG20205 [Phytophthora infestans]
MADNAFVWGANVEQQATKGIRMPIAIDLVTATASGARQVAQKEEEARDTSCTKRVVTKGKCSEHEDSVGFLIRTALIGPDHKGNAMHPEEDPSVLERVVQTTPQQKDCVMLTVGATNALTRSV